MAALEALLPHPVIAEVERDVVARRPGADDDHPPGSAQEFRCRKGRLAGMLEHDLRARLLAERVPDRLAERARALGPFAVRLGVGRVRHLAPVLEIVAV